MSDISQDVVDEIYEEKIERIKNLERKYMKKKIPKKEKFIRWLIKRWLPNHHVSRNPVKKIKELPPIPCNSDNGQAGTSIPVPLESFGAGGSANDINR